MAMTRIGNTEFKVNASENYRTMVDTYSREIRMKIQQMNSSRTARRIVILHVVLTALVVLASCAPEEWIIQRAAKGVYSRGYKYTGVDVDRANVRVRGWNADSVAIAVNMLKDVRNSYAFVVDSAEDSLLLLGKFNGPASLPGLHPEAVLEVPANADLTIDARGSIHVDGLNGPLRVNAQDTASLALSPRGPVFVGSSAGIVLLELPVHINADVDWESGPGGEVRFDSPAFHGQRRRESAKGVIGTGGVKITIRGAKGVEVSFK